MPSISERGRSRGQFQTLLAVIGFGAQGDWYFDEEYPDVRLNVEGERVTIIGQSKLLVQNVLEDAPRFKSGIVKKPPSPTDEAPRPSSAQEKELLKWVEKSMQEGACWKLANRKLYIHHTGFHRSASDLESYTGGFAFTETPQGSPSDYY